LAPRIEEGGASNYYDPWGYMPKPEKEEGKPEETEEQPETPTPVEEPEEPEDEPVEEKPEESEEKKETRVLTGEDIAQVDKFRKMLEKYADQHGLKITDIPGWTEGKIAGMALDPDHKCSCDPSRGRCPCKQGLQECLNGSDHTCKCSVFERDYGKSAPEEPEPEPEPEPEEETDEPEFQPELAIRAKDWWDGQVMDTREKAMAEMMTDDMEYSGSLRWREMKPWAQHKVVMYFKDHIDGTAQKAPEDTIRLPYNDNSFIEVKRGIFESHEYVQISKGFTRHGGEDQYTKAVTFPKDLKKKVAEALENI
ncbi:MAG: hypothetical protein ABIF09_11330, partial [Gemmatimonadota bacterium]